MPKIVDHNERRNHIVKAVIAIIVRDGFDRVTMREIAAEAGYSHGAIVRYFPDKKSLLTAAFLHVFERSHTRTLAVTSGSRGLTALRQMSEAVLPLTSSGSNNARVVLSFWGRAMQDPELYGIHHQNIQKRRMLIRELLQQAINDGEVVEGFDLETGVNQISASFAGWQMMAVLVPEAATAESVSASIRASIEPLRKAPPL